MGVQLPRKALMQRGILKGRYGAWHGLNLAESHSSSFMKLKDHSKSPGKFHINVGLLPNSTGGVPVPPQSLPDPSPPTQKTGPKGLFFPAQ